MRRTTFPLRRAGAALLAAALAAAPGCGWRRSLTVLLTDDILSTDPNRSVEFITDSVLMNVYQPLVALGPDSQIRTALAERWEHPSPERWRFHLRRGVLFHDGSPLTARVAREALLSVQGDPSLEAAGFLRQVVRIEAPADDVLDLVTAQPLALLPSLLPVYVTKRNAPGAFPALLGTGPYRLVAWEAKRRVVLERWDRYWGARPAVRKVMFLPVADAAARMAALARGEADITYGVSPEQAGAPFPKGTKLLRGPGLTVYYLGLDVRDAPDNPFRDVRVRKAFHLAVDRRELVERAVRGAGAAASQPVPPLVFGFNPRLPAAPHDPAEARRLLAAAGFGSGLTVRFDYPKARASAAQCLKEQLAEVGVTLELNPLPRNDVYSLAEAGKSRLAFVGWDCTSGEATEFYEVNLHTRTGRGGRGNTGGYSNPRLDSLCDRSATALDPHERQGLLQEAAAIAMEDLPVLPLFAEDNLFGVRNGISFTPPADGEVRIAELGDD